MNKRANIIFTGTLALIGASSSTGTSLDAFSLGTPMGDHWKRTLVVTPIPVRTKPRKSGKSRAQRKCSK